MFWKLSTLSIALLGMLVSSFAAGEHSVPWKDAGPQNHAPVVVKKRTVFLCCAGCKKKLLANPDKYLKKLDEQNKKK